MRVCKEILLREGFSSPFILVITPVVVCDDCSMNIPLPWEGAGPFGMIQN